MENREWLTLRKRALAELEQSTKILEVALTLLKQGNRVEADRLREQARTQRTISTLLMAEASKLENAQDSAIAERVYLHTQGRDTGQLRANTGELRAY